MSNEKDKQKEFSELPEKKVKLEKTPKTDKRNKVIVAKEYIEKNYNIRLNSDTKEVEFRKIKTQGKLNEYQVIDDQIYKYIKMDVLMNAGINLTNDDYDTMLSSGYFFESYHPFKDYIFSLPKWDGQTDHIKRWCEQVQLADELKYREYFVEGFRRWMTALVMSLIVDVPHPRNCNHVCMVFTGEQSSFKSTFFSNLVPAHLQLRYVYEGKFDFHSNEFSKYLGTKILIKLEELAGFNRSDNESIKSTITQPHVSMRLKWGRKDTYFKRRASFCATTNDRRFLTDITGDRRFFVLPVHNIDIDDTLDIDQVYAQAYALYLEGFRYWFDKEDIKQIGLMNEEFRVGTQEEDMIMKHFFLPRPMDRVNGNVKYMTATDLANWLTEYYKRLNVNNSVVKAIGAIMWRNGFRPQRKWINGRSVQVYEVVAIIEPRFESSETDSLTSDRNDIFES